MITRNHVSAAFLGVTAYLLYSNFVIPAGIAVIGCSILAWFRPKALTVPKEP